MVSLRVPLAVLFACLVASGAAAQSILTVAGGGTDDTAIGVTTDNITLDTKHFVFSSNGGVPATGVTRLSTTLVTPVAPPSPALPNKRKAVGL